MYENEEIFTETDEIGGHDVGVSDTPVYNAGDSIISVSSGDAGSAESIFGGFDYEKFAQSLSPSMAGSVSGGDLDGILSVVQEDVFETLQEINSSVQGLYSLVMLIFVYLLLDWTSRKLLAVVNRFTGRRK